MTDAEEHAPEISMDLDIALGEVERLKHELDVAKQERDAEFRAHEYWSREAARSNHALAELRAQHADLSAQITSWREIYSTARGFLYNIAYDEYPENNLRDEAIDALQKLDDVEYQNGLGSEAAETPPRGPLS